MSNRNNIDFGAKLVSALYKEAAFTHNRMQDTIDELRESNRVISERLEMSDPIVEELEEKIKEKDASISNYVEDMEYYKEENRRLCEENKKLRADMKIIDSKINSGDYSIRRYDYIRYLLACAISPLIVNNELFKGTISEKYVEELLSFYNHQVEGSFPNDSMIDNILPTFNAVNHYNELRNFAYESNKNAKLV